MARRRPKVTELDASRIVVLELGRPCRVRGKLRRYSAGWYIEGDDDGLYPVTVVNEAEPGRFANRTKTWALRKSKGRGVVAALVELGEHEPVSVKAWSGGLPEQGKTR